MTALTRRGALAAGAGAAFAPLSAWSAHSDLLAVFDGRYRDSRAFAAEAERRGALLFDARGDLARIWRGRPAPPWRVAGLVTPADAALAAAALRERGLTFRAEGVHDGRGRTGLAHRIEGLGDGIGEGEADWAKALAALACGARLGVGGRLDFETARASDHPGTLFSWVAA